MTMERTVAIAKESLGEAGFQSASCKGIIWEEGARWSLEEAVKRCWKDDSVVE